MNASQLATRERARRYADLGARIAAGLTRLEAQANAGDFMAADRLIRAHALLATAQARRDAGHP